MCIRDSSKQGPPNDTVVYINVQEVRVAQTEGEEEAIGWMEDWRITRRLALLPNGLLRRR